jgi:hypothetical protein
MKGGRRWSVVYSEKELRKALKLARGRYQRNLLLGYENLSGDTLKGAARRAGKHYKESREALLCRMATSKRPIDWRIHRGKHGALFLVFGQPPPPPKPYEQRDIEELLDW